MILSIVPKLEDLADGNLGTALPKSGSLIDLENDQEGAVNAALFAFMHFLTKGDMPETIEEVSARRVKAKRAFYYTLGHHGYRVVSIDR